MLLALALAQAGASAAPGDLLGKASVWQRTYLSSLVKTSCQDEQSIA